MLKAKQTIICQVTKNPIGAKGARLTQEVSLPGRFVVLIPNSSTYGISKRLSDDERKRLRAILDRVKPKQHGVIVRTAAEGVTDQEVEQDVRRLLDQWDQIDALAKRSQAPALLYREPDMAVRVIREEFNNDYRGVVIDDPALYESVRDYVALDQPRARRPGRAASTGPRSRCPLYERFHIHEQLHKALDRKVWLPSGGSLIIEHTEALTVIDVNTGKNVGTSNLEETVFRNNLEAAVEIARQLRLRDVGGIIVVDFIDMEIRPNRDEVDPGLPGGAGPGQDPHPGLRDLRAGPLRDDPEADRGGAPRVLRRPVPALRGPGPHHRPRPAPPGLSGSAGRRGRHRPSALEEADAMYAVIKTGGKQEKVEAGQVLNVEKLGKAVGDEITLTPVLLVDGDTVLATPEPARQAPPSPPRSSARPRARRSTASPTRTRATSGSAGATASTTTPSRSPASRRAEGAHDVQDQGRRFHPERPRLQRPAPRREGATTAPPSPPARSSCASGAPSSTPARTSAAAATTPCSPRPTAR